MKHFHVNLAPPEPVAFYPTKESKQVLKEVDGHMISTFETVIIDPCKVNEGLKADDFRLDVLIANNAVDLLKPSKPLNQSNLTVADTVSKFE